MSPPSRESHPGETMQPSIPPGVPDIGGPAESQLEVIVGAYPTQNTEDVREVSRRAVARLLDKMLSQPTGKLRAELLAWNGVCPEFADSIPYIRRKSPGFCGRRSHPPHLGSPRNSPRRHRLRRNPASVSSCSWLGRRPRAKESLHLFCTA